MKNDLVVKHNSLIEARYKLNLNEQKVLLYAITKLDRNKDKFNVIEFNVAEFTELIGSESNRYEEIRDIVRSLRRKEVIINTKEKEYITGWLSSINFYKGKGKIKLKFDDELVPYLLQLQETFTRYKLENILYLKNKHSIRLYELLKQYEKIGKRKFTVDKLKDLLMLDDKYKRFYDFERYVIKSAIKEINDLTDIKIGYEKIKKGRKIDSILFTIESKQKEDKLLDELYNIPELKKQLGINKENFSSKQVINIYEVAVEATQDEVDVYKYVQANYMYMCSKNGVKNRYSYLLEAVREDFANFKMMYKLFSV